MNLQLDDFRFRTPAPRRGFCFWTNAHQMRGDSPNANGYCLGMDDLTDDDLFLDAVDAIVLDALAKIGATRERGTPSSSGSWRWRRRSPRNAVSDRRGCCDSDHSSARLHRPATQVAPEVDTATDTPIQAI